MSTDTLDQSTDAQLNELFAVEVAGPVEHVTHETAVSAICIHCGWETWQDEQPCCRNYTTDANAVLPWLGCSWRAQQSEPGTVWVDVDSPAFGTATAPTFPRAAVIALIRAKRASK